MRTIFLMVFTLALTTFVGTAMAADEPAPPAVPPPIPATPAAVDDVLFIRPFTMDEGYVFEWTKDRAMMTSGTLLVLKVDPALVFSRQVAEPVLYVGNKTAERVNIGYESGHVIAIVPGDVDLKKEPVWFGTPELPERVDAATVKSERAQADQAGIAPFSAEKVDAALSNGGARLSVADQDELLRGQVSALIRQYAADEEHLAVTFNVPVTK